MSNFEFNIQNKCNRIIQKIFDYIDLSPKKYHFDIIQEIKLSSLKILKNIIWSNNTNIQKEERGLKQQEAINYCIYVENLLLLCRERTIISKKQFTSLINDLTSLHENLINWKNSDEKRFKNV